VHCEALLANLYCKWRDISFIIVLYCIAITSYQVIVKMHFYGFLYIFVYCYISTHPWQSVFIKYDELLNVSSNLTRAFM